MLERIVNWISKKENNKIFIVVVTLFVLVILYLFIHPRLVYKNEYENFLDKRYNQEFEVKFSEIDEILLENGEFKKVYIYEFYDKKIPDIKGYIICESNNEIYESYAEHMIDESERNVKYYEKKLKLYEQKIKIEDDLKELYDDFINFDLLYDSESIFISIDIEMEDNIYDDPELIINLYNSIIDLLNGTDIKVKLRFTDCVRDITGNSNKLTKENITSLF